MAVAKGHTWGIVSHLIDASSERFGCCTTFNCWKEVMAGFEKVSLVQGCCGCGD